VQYLLVVFLLETMMTSFGNKMKTLAVSIMAGSVLGMVACPVWAACDECATVIGVNVTEKQGESSGIVGGIAGGALGGLLGHQFGRGKGKDIATVGGAVAGTMAGQQVEKKLSTTKSYEVIVKFDNGKARVLTLSKDPEVKEGDRVKVYGDRVVLDQ
jgi:outer membrane lipoprotein SlyB